MLHLLEELQLLYQLAVVDESLILTQLDELQIVSGPAREPRSNPARGG